MIGQGILRNLQIMTLLSVESIGLKFQGLAQMTQVYSILWDLPFMAIDIIIF